MNLDLLRKPNIQILLIIFIGLLIYSNTFNAEFTLDDKPYIIENPAIKDFSYFGEPSKVLKLNQMGTGYRYAFITRIVTHFTFALNYHLHKLNVFGYHLFNIFVHIANGLLVYFLVRIIFQTSYFTNGKSSSKSFGPFTQDIFAFLSALIFISHPIQTQAVTYISQRFASLAALFYLLALLMYIKSRLSVTRHEKYVLYGLSLMSAITAMLTKENSFTLPVIIALSEVMFFKGKFKEKVLFLLPFAVTMLVIPATLFLIEGSSFSIGSVEYSTKTSTDGVTRFDYLFTQFSVIVAYIRLMFFPISQTLDYDYPVYHSFFSPHVFFSFLFLVFLFSLGIYFHYRSENSKTENSHGFRLISFGIFWFFITLSVESSIIVLRNVIFEHRLYLPSVGFILCVMAATNLVVNEVKNKKVTHAVITCIVVAIFILAGTAYARNSVWQNNIVLWEDVVRKSPQKARPHHNLGVAYARRGRTEDAIREYNLAININPDSAVVHNDLALAYAAMGRTEKAQREHKIAGNLKPGFVKAHNNLGFSYMKQGFKEEAIREYLFAIKINPDNFEAHNNLGILYAQKELFDEALREFQAARAIAPNNVSVRRNIETINRLNK